MLRNYLTIALRNLSKNKVHTFINVAGLSIGMACCLLLFLLIRHEWSYDSFNEKADRIFRTSAEYHAPDGTVNYQNMMFPDFTPQLVDEFPAIEKATRFVGNPLDLQVEDELFRNEVVEVDAPFFEIFSYPLVSGNPATVLVDPASMVITTEVAKAWFGVDKRSYDQAVGRTVSIERNGEVYDFTITGVSEPPPSNSSLDFEVAIPFENYDNIRLGGNNWGGRTSTYVLLDEQTTPEAFEKALIPFVDLQFADYMEGLRANGFLIDEASDAEAFRMHLQPLREVHRHPDIWVPYEAQPHDPLYSYILAGIGFLVLIIACINFTMLTIGRSSQRQREVGMRKVLGAQRRQLLVQFWGEAVVMTGVSMVLAIVITWAALPWFNSIAAKELSLSMVPPLQFGIALVALLLIVGLVAGGYPAAVLSRFAPASVLRGSTPIRRQGLTRTLVVLQYTISIGLTVATIIMASQLSYVMHKDLGYDKDLVMIVHANQVDDAEAADVVERFRARLLPDPRIAKLARSGQTFNRGSDRNTWTDENGVTRQAYNFGVGFDYIDLMDMKIVAGRNFSRDYPSDSTHSVLVNEALVREFGLKDPVGKPLTGWLDFVYDESPIIIGVVKDFNFKSLHEEVQPAVMNMHPNYYNFLQAILVKIKPDDVNGAIAEVESAWHDILPGKPFTYSFLDEDLARMYQDDQRWTSIVEYSSLLAILIACLGMFGLATISVTRRTKEIGVRKVLGASVSGVLRLVASEFVLLIVVSAVFAFPLAYFAMDKWLAGFASKIDIGPWAFVLAGAAALTVALASISYHAIKAATANPVKALRYE